MPIANIASTQYYVLKGHEPSPSPLNLSDRKQGWVNLAGKAKNLFLVIIDVYRLENRKIEVCRVSGGGGLGEPMGVGDP